MAAIRYFDLPESVMHPAWFFATDISMAGCRGHEEIPLRAPLDDCARTGAVEAAPLPSPFAIDWDEEPSWAEEEFRRGNDVY